MHKNTIGFAAIFCTMLMCGCGSDDGLGKRYSVTGMVTYKGQPLEKGTVTFYPVTPDPKGINNGANGTIVDGKYSLSTRGDNDGAFPGEYVVGIISKDVDMTKAKGNVKGGVFKQDDVAKAYKTAKSLIPSKYAIPETSGFKATVAERSNTFDFEIKD